MKKTREREKNELGWISIRNARQLHRIPKCPRAQHGPSTPPIPSATARRTPEWIRPAQCVSHIYEISHIRCACACTWQLCAVCFVAPRSGTVFYLFFLFSSWLPLFWFRMGLWLCVKFVVGHVCIFPRSTEWKYSNFAISLANDFQCFRINESRFVMNTIIRLKRHNKKELCREFHLLTTSTCLRRTWIEF